jgi:hypothetical protein
VRRWLPPIAPPTLCPIGMIASKPKASLNRGTTVAASSRINVSGNRSRLAAESAEAMPVVGDHAPSSRRRQVCWKIPPEFHATERIMEEMDGQTESGRDRRRRPHSGAQDIMPAATIPTVGTLIYFLDTEGNKLGAMKYDTPPGKHQA